MMSPPFSGVELTMFVSTTAVGASFTSLRLTVMVALALNPPPSMTCTVKLKAGLVSKSSAALLATLIAPLLELITNALLVLPAVMLYRTNEST